MKKIIKSNLTLRSETIRSLTTHELRDANGGFTGPSSFVTDCCTVNNTALCSAVVAATDVSCAPTCADHGCV